jgi:hypothetical protein
MPDLAITRTNRGLPRYVGVTSHQIRLADSGRLCVLRRSQCTVGKATKRYSLPPSHVFIIEQREV